MRGIFSSAPGQPAIRVMVGTHLLLLVQCWLVLYSASGLDSMLRLMVGMTAFLGLLAFGFAVHGGSEWENEVWRPRHREHAGSGIGRQQ